MYLALGLPSRATSHPDEGGIAVRTPSFITREELLRRANALGGMVDQCLIMLLFGNDWTLASVSRDRNAIVGTLSLIWDRGMET